MPRVRPKLKAKEPVIRLLGPGQCEANCTVANCPRGMQPIIEFAPAVSNMTHKKRGAFFKIVKAINAINDVLNDPECMKLLDKAGLLRTKHCLTCRLATKKTQQNPTTKLGACRAKWREIKAKLEEDGCSLCGSHDGMTVEHTKPEEKMRDKKGNTANLGEYRKWTVLGGPEAMQAEYDKPSVVPMCFNCQFMQPTHTAMKPKIDPDLLPEVSQCDDKAAYKKKRNLTQRCDKREYVNYEKVFIGKCADCNYRVVRHGDEWTPGVSGWPHAFQFAHRSELDKEDGVAKIVSSRLSYKSAEPLLDAEMARCRLLCMCCGKTETEERTDAPGPSEEGN